MTDKETPRQAEQTPAEAAKQGKETKPKNMEANRSTSNSVELISVTVAPFTGGPFSLSVKRKDSVEELKKAVAKKLKVLKDRICLLYRERQLSEGTLEDNFLVDGSRITLLPRAETGLLAQKPEQSVMQALESLSESQVVDFLSGKAPLNLTMRLGDHMMLIQLQLSTVNSSLNLSSSSKRSRLSSPSSPPQTSPHISTHSSVSSSPCSLNTSPCPPPPHPTATTSPASSPSTSTPNSPTSPTSSPSSTSSTSSTSTSSSTSSNTSYKPKLDTRALAEASKNLTQTLKQLSSEVLTTKAAEEPERPRKRPRHAGGGAIIESMHHHGKGVYSGTFSGTLNPALQDRNGQPKRDITTIIHILNDLLCAQYKNYQFAPASASAAASARARPHAATATQTSNDFGVNNTGANLSNVAKNESSVSSAKSSVLDQLEVTKTKIEQLRRIMEERKVRRRAKREAARSAPYSTSWSVQSEPNVSSTTSPDAVEVSDDSSDAASEADSPNTTANAAGSDSSMFNSKAEPVTA